MLMVKVSPKYMSALLKGGTRNVYPKIESFLNDRLEKIPDKSEHY